MNKTFSKKSAFSLIELSIVLLIIGLLVAGVTGGASLIRSSELRAALSEARGYSVAVNTFYTRYVALPGDYKTAINGSLVAGATNGGDDKIQYYAGDVTTYLSENVVAWSQLRKSGIIDKAYAPLVITSDQVIGTNRPAAKIKNAGWSFDYRMSPGTAFTTTYVEVVNEGLDAAPANQNVLVLSGLTGTTAPTDLATLANSATGTAGVATAVLTGSDAEMFDKKADDGVANAGKIRALNAATDPCYTANASADADYTINPAKAGTKVCAMTYQVDVGSNS